MSRLSDGARKIVSIAEIVGMESDVITMQDLFLFDREGMTPEGKVAGHFRATGIRPKCAERLQEYGIDLAETLFANLGLASGMGR